MSIAKILGEFSVKCANCGKEYNFYERDTEFEEVTADERSGGVEYGHKWEYDFECRKCGQDIEVEYSAYEYPEGTENGAVPQVKGGFAVKEFVFQFKVAHNEDREDYDL